MEKKGLLIAALALAGGVALALWPERAIRHPPGETAPDPPEQELLEETPVWMRGDYMLTALATYRIRARVLGRERYYLDDESELSPIDLVLGWGPMSDQAVVDAIDIDQGFRAYTWWTDAAPVPFREIELSSANVHILPANDAIEDEVLDLDSGELVELSGYLVQVEGDDGWKWKTSLTREDTGNGACEVFWVDEVLRPPI